MVSPPRQCAGSFRNYSIPLLDFPPYIPELVPCDFYLFSEIKSALKGKRLVALKAVKEKVARDRNELTEKKFKHYFQQWKICMKRCRDKGCLYIGGDNMYEIKIKSFIAPSR